MPIQNTVLLAGGTGRTGFQVLQQLLGRGVNVRAIVRSPEKLPPEVRSNPHLSVIEASILALGDAGLEKHLRGCDAVISCLGHVLDLKGICGQPRKLVTEAVTRLCRGVEAIKPAAPVKFILMGSVSVNRPRRLDARRGLRERAILWMMRGLLPPANDNQCAADFLLSRVGPNNAYVRWVIVRPDSLLEGDVSAYTLHESLVSSLFAPGSTNMANVAHFMCELATNQKTWAEWEGMLPVIVNEPAKAIPPKGA